jgi:hypothetical protein
MVVKRSRAEELLNDLSEEITDVREHIAKGGCSDWGAYCSESGRYKALLDARHRLTDYFAAEEEDEE